MKSQKRFRGVVVPMVTPATSKMTLDEDAVCRIVDHLVQGSCIPFVSGTTGEASSLSSAVRDGLVRTTVQHAAGRMPVIAGISSNCMEESVAAGKRYLDLGAAAVVAHLPCYFSLIPDEMRRYYETLADSVSGPVMVYNIPITTHMSIPMEVVESLSHHPHIVGFKDSENEPSRMEAAVPLWKDRDDFCYLVGVGLLMAKGLLLGADGIVPSAANVAPEDFREMCEAAWRGEEQKVLALQERTMRLTHIYVEGRTLGQSLAALKAMMEARGLCGGAMFPPLVPLTEPEKAEIQSRLAKWA